MQTIKLTDQIAPKFYKVHRALKKELIEELWLKGGRGSTKSSFASIEIILGIKRNPGSNAIILRRYENELRESVYGQMVWAIFRLGLEHEFKMNVSPMKITYIATGQMIIFKGADNPIKAKSINLGAGYFKYAWFEEVDQFGGMTEIRSIIQSVFRGEDTNRIAIFSYNPPKSARSWVNKETKIEKAARVVHSSNYLDINPKWLGKRFITEAEHIKKTRFDAYRHEYLGEEIGTGLEIFNNVTIRKITDEEINYFDQTRQGLDFGYAVDPMDFIKMHYLRKKRQVFMYFEIHGINISNRKFAELLPDECKNENTIADSAEPKSIDELRDDYGLRIDKAHKPAGSVEQGTKWLADLEEIVIDPERCPLAAEEFVNYALGVTKSGETISKYPDKDNHAIDATRYALEHDINGELRKVYVATT